MRKLAGVAVTLALVFGMKFCSKHRFSGEVRTAMYERYSELGSAEDVRKLVDEHHGTAFDECYRMGFKRTKTEFDAERYADLMDRKVRSALDSISTKARLAELEAMRKATGRHVSDRAPAAAVPTPVPRATPAPHSLQIMTLTVQPSSPERAIDAGMRQYVIDALLSDEADDVTPAAPPHFELALQCDGAFVGQGQRMAGTSVRPLGSGKVMASLTWDAPAADVDARSCELLVTAKDGAGNQAPLQRKELPAR